MQIARIIEKTTIHLNTGALVLTVSFFFLYFGLNCGITLNTNGTTIDDVYFGLDQARAFGDLTSWGADHYRTNVHPLFVIMLQPLVKCLNLIVGDLKATVMLLQALLGALAVSMVYVYLVEIGVVLLIRVLLTLIYGTSFSQLLFTLAPETYIYGGVSLLGMHYFMLRRIKFEKYSTTGLILAGIVSISVTVTNFTQFIIALYFLLKRSLLDERRKRQIFCMILLLVIFFTSIIAGFQQILYPSSGFFLSYIFYPSEELSYMYVGERVSVRDILITTINGDYSGSWQMARSTFDGEKILGEAYTNLLGRGLIFGEFDCVDSTEVLLQKEFKFVALSGSQFGFATFFNIIVLTAIIMGIILLKTKQSYKSSVFSILLLSLVFNLALHTVYARNEGWLFSQHYLFLMVFLVGLVSSQLDTSKIARRFLTNLELGICLLAFLIFQVYNNYLVFLKLQNLSYVFLVW